MWCSGAFCVALHCVVLRCFVVLLLSRVVSCCAVALRRAVLFGVIFNKKKLKRFGAEFAFFFANLEQ